MRRKMMSVLLCAAMTAGFVAGCGGNTGDASSDNAAASTSDSSTAAGTESGSAEAASSSGDLIKVGIINNDPNESGYRTAND